MDTRNQAYSLKPEHYELFYAKILGKVVISSVTNAFYTTLKTMQETIQQVTALCFSGWYSPNFMPVSYQSKRR